MYTLDSDLACQYVHTLTASWNTHLCSTVCTVSSAMFLARILADRSRPTNTVPKPEYNDTTSYTTQVTAIICTQYVYQWNNSRITALLSTSVTLPLTTTATVNTHNSCNTPHRMLHAFIVLTAILKVRWLPLWLPVSSHPYPEHPHRIHQNFCYYILYFRLYPTYLHLPPSQGVLKQKFLQVRCHSCHPNNSIKALNAQKTQILQMQ